MQNNMITELDPAETMPALQQNLNTMVRLQASDLVRVIDTNQVVRSVSTIPFPLANFVTYANISVPDAIDKMLVDYPHGQSLWFLMPTSTRDIARQGLIANSFSLVEERPIFTAKIIDVMPNDSTSFNVIEVQTQQQMQDWITTQSIAHDGFSDDVLRIYTSMMTNLVNNKNTFAYVAYDGDTPVGCAILTLAGGVAGFYQLAVIPDARRKGVGTALARHRMQVALEHGYHIAGMMVTQMGQIIHSKIGFQEIEKVHLYMKV